MMNRDKQIAEMANIIAFKAFEQAHLENGDDNLADIVAIELYDNGYRKASEVAREIFEEIEKVVEVALMNGHIETPILCIGHGTFAELKKKYTEGDNDVK